VHAYLAHQFGGGAHHPPNQLLQLTARARQFSSFLLLIGRLGPGSTFEPSHAIIVKDKDELRIPLMLEQLPTPKAFRDAIASLSPEQQRFARAVRDMQLAGSVFGILLLQLKPQLERVLNLPPDSLTKEIALTQNLLDLFIQYQIPTDLLSYDGDASAPMSTKLEAVKQHTKAINDMIGAAKANEIAGAKQRADYAHPHGGDGGRMPKAAPAEMEEDHAELLMASAAMADSTDEEGVAPVRRMRSSGGAASSDPPRAAAAAAAPRIAAFRTASAARIQRAHSVRVAEPMFAADAPVQNAPVEESTLAQQPRDRAKEHTAFTSQPSSSPPSSSPPSAVDFTAIPRQLEAAYDRLDADAAIRPTRIIVTDTWRRRAQPSLLEPATESVVSKPFAAREKQKAFDLLDALSRSGALTFDAASLHVLVAATHRFDQSLTDTVVSNNVNPIEKVERSSLIIASTIHSAPAADLLRSEQRARVASFSAPALLRMQGQEVEGRPA